MTLGSINTLKELAQAYCPLLLAAFHMPSGDVLRFASQPLNTFEGGVQFEGNDYLARVMDYDITATAALSENGIDYTPQVTISLADPDRLLWVNGETGSAGGFKGAMATLTFVFYDPISKEFSSNKLVRFVGICSSPKTDTIILSVTATSFMNLQQAMLPTMRIQRTCPHMFPVTPAQRQEAADDESSPFHGCGYSPDATGPNARGNLVLGQPLVTCNKTRGDCMARLGKGDILTGDIMHDSSDRHTGRFAGIQYMPVTSSVSRGYISSKFEEIINNSNEAKYGDLVPLVYGQIWLTPPVLDVSGDANFTTLHILLGSAEFESVEIVTVNGTQIPHSWFDGLMSDRPPGVTNLTDGSKSGYWTCINRGTRDGHIDQSIHATQQPDPYGGMCVLNVHVPRKLADSNTIPNVQVLVKGGRIRKYYASDPGGGVFDAVSGLYWKKLYSDTLGWVLLDVLTWAGIRYDRVNLQSFIDYAASCDTQLEYKNQFGNTSNLNSDGSPHKRYSASLVIRQRRSATEVIRGLRNAGRAILYLDNDGKLAIREKRTLAEQQPAPVPGSNYPDPFSSLLADGTTANGYPAYKFDESNIAKQLDGKTPSLRVTQQTLQEGVNHCSLLFQDQDNHWVPDTLDILETEDIARTGIEINGSFPLEGINNRDQGRRVTSTWMAENFRGNTSFDWLGQPFGDTRGTLIYEWETTFKTIHLSTGDICLLTYQQLGVEDQLVRISKIQPSSDFSRVKITAHYHNDGWYLNTYGQLDPPIWRSGLHNTEPRPAYAWSPYAEQPLEGDTLYPRTEFNFSLAQQYVTDASGSAIAQIRLGGYLPINTFNGLASPPFLTLQGQTASSGGTIPGGRTYHFAICAIDANGLYSLPSTIIEIHVPAGTNTNTVSIPVPYWRPGTAGYAIFGGTRPNKLAFQDQRSDMPVTPVVLTSFKEAYWSMPDKEFDHILLRGAVETYAGAIAQVVSCASGTITVYITTHAQFDTNQWQNYTVSLLGFKPTSDVGLNVPIVNWTVASNTGDTLTLAGGGFDPVAIPRGDGTYGLNPGDIIAIRLRPTVGSDGGGHYIEDANLINNLNELFEHKTVIGATNASPIEITTAGNHFYATGQTAYLHNIGGNAAANGQFQITVTAANKFTLNGTTGSGGYTSGGVVARRQRGFDPNALQGRFLFAIAGTGRGMRCKIKSNTQTRLYIEGNWPVTPDTTTRFVVLEPSQIEARQASVNNDNPLALTSMAFDVSNYKEQPMFIQAFAVDGGNFESFASDSPFRDQYLFGGAGFGGFRGAIHLTIDGSIAIGANQSRIVFVHSETRAVAVRAKVKNAPSGGPIVMDVVIGGVTWITLTIPDGDDVVEFLAVDMLAGIPANTDIQLDITSVPAGPGNDPGSDLAVMIFIQ